MKAVSRKNNTRNNAGASNIATAVVPKPRKPSTPPTTLELAGVTIHFPFAPYQCQRDYMQQVLNALHRSENALLESPTGTGKTLCLLCAALAWQQEQARTGTGIVEMTQSSSSLSQQQQQGPSSSTTTQPKKKRVPTIIYASRTHSQLSQVVRELKNTRYRPKHALLGSRAQMCVHKKVKTKEATASDINHDCNKLGKDRKCSFRNNLGEHGHEFKAPPNEPGAHPGMQPVMDMEDLLQMGQSKKVCPFYYTRSLVEDAELILVPYNYLFDKDARDTTLQSIPWNNSVVIFDEAHNLESFCSDAASFDVTSLDIAGCIQEVQKVLNYQQAMPELMDRISSDNLVRLKSLFLTLEEYLLHKVTMGVFAGDYMMRIFSEGAMMNHGNHAMFCTEAKKVSEIIMDLRSSGSANKGQTKIDFFVSCVKRVFSESSECRCYAKAKSYRVHIATSNQKSAVRTISYWCFAPSLAMQELANLDVRSIIVTSGTLSPLPSYSLELGIPFVHSLENPHIIKDDQIHVRVIGNGISGKSLSSSFQRREDPEYTSELGSTIVNLARVVPAGMLIFFPSYGVMEKCIETWGGPASGRRRGNNNQTNAAFFAAKQKPSNNSGQYSFPWAPDYYASSSSQPQSVWKRLLCQKAVVLEPKSTSDLTDAIAEFHKYLSLPKSSGCVLMGVCRGKISEGIDFAHDQCRAVIITGLPFSPYLDPKVKLKREYLDAQRAEKSVRGSGDGGFGNGKHGSNNNAGTPIATSLSGMEWYTQQAHRAVNQAIGRVIRNKQDYGAVLLLDERFGEPRNKAGLSKWVRDRVLPNETFGIAVSGLAKFYRSAKELQQQNEQQRPPPIVLAYEQDKSEESNTSQSIELLTTDRIAVVKSSSQQDEENNNYISSDQVLATMDLKNIEQPQKEVTKQSTDQEEGSKKEGSKKSALSDLYTTSSSELVPSTSTSSSSAWASVQTTITSKTPAQLFFATAKSRLDAQDFASLRKLLVSMKKYGDAEDSAPYLKEATKLVVILTRYDRYLEGDEKWEQSLCHLLFPLLPQRHQLDIQKVALRKQLQRSDFIKRCQVVLPHEQHKPFYSSVFSALKQVYCVQPAKTFSRSAYLKACLPVMRYLFDKKLHLKTDDGKSMAERFCLLLPSTLRVVSKGLLSEILACSNTQRTKDREKGREGENGVDTVRFRERLRQRCRCK